MIARRDALPNNAPIRWDQSYEPTARVPGVNGGRLRGSVEAQVRSDVMGPLVRTGRFRSRRADTEGNFTC
ncbi:hypothetical protein GCM10010260_29540 [Streptomyces filipinensis]|uniref:Uncharacterized protein n=1 Tax=Streptomyces filipinensis TaxID=66887 RepID=A0A918IC73_9ACTN|nr:hypothetical protein GCM10010260_29540 [Streptomyces filipinensis]